MLIKWRGAAAEAADDPFTAVADDESMAPGDVLISFTRFLLEGEGLLREVRNLGVRLAPGDDLAALGPSLGRLALIALEFPKFRDGRAYSAAMLLRERLGWRGELRAVGDVLVEQALVMVRCGFDAFEPADGSSPEAWTRAAEHYAYVYQRATDSREPAFVLRGEA